MSDQETIRVRGGTRQRRDTGYEDDVDGVKEDLQEEIEGLSSKVSGRSTEILQQALQLASMNAVRNVAAKISDFLPFCESELEKTLLSAFVAESQVDNEICLFPACLWENDVSGFIGTEMDLHMKGRFHDHGPDPIMVFMQVPIDEYRVDFLIYGISAESDDASTWGRVKLVVECDGHDFHEKTKQQAKRDKLRDRRITANGYTIMRFTGSEIWRDPRKVVLETLAFVRKELGRQGRIRRGLS